MQQGQAVQPQLQLVAQAQGAQGGAFGEFGQGGYSQLQPTFALSILRLQQQQQQLLAARGGALAGHQQRPYMQLTAAADPSFPGLLQQQGLHAHSCRGAGLPRHSPGTIRRGPALRYASTCLSSVATPAHHQAH